MLPKTSVFKHAALRGTVEGESALIAPEEDGLRYRYAVISYGSDLIQTEDSYIGIMDHHGRFNELEWFTLPKDAKVSVNEFRYPWDSPLAMMPNEDKDVFTNNTDGYGAARLN